MYRKEKTKYKYKLDQNENSIRSTSSSPSSSKSSSPDCNCKCRHRLKSQELKNGKCRKNELKTHLIAFVVSIFCFINALDGDFVHDDIPAVCSNPDVTGKTSLSQVFHNDFWGKPMSHPDSHKSYRPLTILTFRFNSWLTETSSTSPCNGLNPRGFHLVNIMIHALVVQLVILLLRNEFNCSGYLTLVTSLFFATHPIHTEAVSSIVGRADLLAALFSLLSFLFHSRALHDYGNWKSYFWLGISAMSALLALLSKETGIMILPISVTYFLVQRKNKRNKAASFDGRTLPALGLEFGPFLVPVITMTALLLFRIWILHGSLPYFTEQDNPAAFSTCLISRLLTYSYLMAFNVYLLVFPYNLSYDWQMGSIPLITSFLDLRNLLTIMAMVPLILLFLKSLDLGQGTIQSLALSLEKHVLRREKKQVSLVGSVDRSHMNQEVEKGKADDEDDEIKAENLHLLLGLCFLGIPFIPASNLLVTVGFVVAERVLYLPSLGLTVLVMCGWRKLLRFSSSATSFPSLCIMSFVEKRKPSRKLNILIKLLFYGLLVSFMFKTIHRNRVWLSRKSLFESGLISAPLNAKVHYNYANLQKDLGNTDLASRHYEQAIRLWPNHESAHNNLGTICVNSDEAEEHFKRALEINPFHSRSHFNLANIYNKKGFTSKAINLLKRSIELDRNFAEPYSVLASIYSDHGMIDSAKVLHRKALELLPNNPDLINNYGAFLQASGNTPEAVTQYLKAVDIHPKHNIALGNLMQIMHRHKLAPDLLKHPLSN